MQTNGVNILIEGNYATGPGGSGNLRRTDIADPEARVPYAAVLRLIERAATLLDDPSLGLRLGASHEAGDSELLDFAVLNSPTLMEALKNLQRDWRWL